MDYKSFPGVFFNKLWMEFIAASIMKNIECCDQGTMELNIHHSVGKLIMINLQDCYKFLKERATDLPSVTKEVVVVVVVVV